MMVPRSNRPPWLVLTLSLGLIVLCIGALLGLGLSKTGGTFSYPLDDTYIHLSLARNLLENGNWGLMEGRPAFAASSPAYVCLLAGGLALVDWQGWPLLINFIVAIAVLGWLARTPLVQRSPVGFLPAALLLLPLPLLVISGMEHLLHIAFAGLWLQVLLKEEDATKGSSIKTFLLASLMTAFRYESLFLLVGAIPFLAHKKGIKLLVFSLLGGAGSVLGLGIWSLTGGGTFLPLSLIGKGHSPLLHPGAWLFNGLTTLYENPFMWVGLGLMVWIWASKQTSTSQKLRRGAGAVAIAILLHVFFAEVGGYRYEAYLLALATGLVWSYADANKSSLPKLTLPYQILLLIGLFPFLIRAGFFYLNTPLAMKNIHDQPFQVARFLEAYYPDQPVGLNDIGWASWSSNIELTDMVGIGDQEVRHLRTDGQYSPQTMDSLLSQRNVNLIIGHEIWIGSIIPDRFQPVGQWCLPDNFICADACITFWASSSLGRSVLSTRLKQFQSQLPKDLQVSYLVSE